MDYQVAQGSGCLHVGVNKKRPLVNWFNFKKQTLHTTVLSIPVSDFWHQS